MRTHFFFAFAIFFCVASLSAQAQPSAVLNECYGYCELSHPPLVIKGVEIGPRTPSSHTLFATGSSETEIIHKLKTECESIPHTSYISATKWLGNAIGPDSVNCRYENGKAIWDEYASLKNEMISENKAESFSPQSEIIPRVAKIPQLNQSTLIVVHASSVFDSDQSAKAGIDQEIQNFKRKKQPVVFLVNDLSNEGQKAWYTQDRQPDYLAYSAGGENTLPMITPDVTMVGGFFGNNEGASGCLTRAIHDVINSYFYRLKQNKPLTIHLPVKSIYYYSEDGIALELERPQVDFHRLFSDIQSSIFTSDDNKVGTIFGDGYNYRMKGLPESIHHYRFEFYYHHRLAMHYGTGKRIVRLMLESLH